MPRSATGSRTGTRRNPEDMAASGRIRAPYLTNAHAICMGVCAGVARESPVFTPWPSGGTGTLNIMVKNKTEAYAGSHPSHATLRARRQRAGLPVVQLAALADCSPGAINYLEGGYRPKRSAVLARLDAALTELEAGTQTVT
jgi:hypothetical protein